MAGLALRADRDIRSRVVGAAAGTLVIEVGHPATQPDKSRRLSSLGVPLDRLALVAVGLIEDDLATALAAAGHRGDRASLFICEGLFSYLPLSVSVAVCHALRIRVTSDSVLAASFLVSSTPRAASRVFQRAVGGFLSVIGEIRATKFRSGKPERLLQQSSWTILRRTALPARGLDAGGPLVLSASPRDDTATEHRRASRRHLTTLGADEGLAHSLPECGLVTALRSPRIPAIAVCPRTHCGALDRRLRARRSRRPSRHNDVGETASTTPGTGDLA
jgi:Leucine carboxyl methyltransferase